MKELLFFAACVSSVLGTGFPMGVPSLFQNPPFSINPGFRIPEGVAYVPTNGGGYFISSAATPTLGWLTATGIWTEVALIDTNFTSYGTFGMEYEATENILYVARADLSGALFGTGLPKGALTAWNLTSWTRKWTVDLGTGFANDLTVDPAGFIYVTDTAFGKIWSVDTTTLQVTIAFSNSSVLGPYCNPVSPSYVVINPAFPNCSVTSVGINGLKWAGSVSSTTGSYLIGGIAQSGISRSRIYCFDTTVGANPAFWPLTFLNAASYPTLSTTVADGLEWMPIGNNQHGYLISTGAPASAFVIDLISGAWCEPAATYNITWLGTVGGTQSPSTFPPPNGGNSLTTVTYNCDFDVAVALGTSFAPLSGGPPPTQNGLFVVGGGASFTYGVAALPYAPLQYFPPGYDCSTAIPVVPNGPANFYDMSCFLDARVTVPGASGYCGGEGYGIWFYVNTTGLTGLWDVTTRTVFTIFDNELTVYSQCPTYCGQSYTDDAFMICEDDVGGADPTTSWVTTHPDNCSASSTRYCARVTLDLSAQPRTGIYVVVNFYSTPATPGLETNTFAFVSHNAGVGVPVQCVGNPYCTPARVCNPGLCNAFTQVLEDNGMTVFASPPDISIAAAAGITNATITPYTVFAPGDSVYQAFLLTAAANGQVQCLTNETGPAVGVLFNVVSGWLIFGQNVDPSSLATANLTTVAGTRLWANNTHIWVQGGTAAMYYGPYCTAAGGNIVGSVYLIDNFIWTPAEMAALNAACPPAACAPNCAGGTTAGVSGFTASASAGASASSGANPGSSGANPAPSNGPAPSPAPGGSPSGGVSGSTPRSSSSPCTGADCSAGSGVQSLSVF